MVKNTGLIEEIFTRRIPHIIGMYIAAVWLSVEIADWMSDRFNVSGQFSSYVFIGMLVFIPSVIMLAWGHGKPGRDNWSKLETLCIPLNMIASIVAINMFVTKTDLKSVSISTSLAEPITSTSLVGSVSRIETNTNLHNRVISFFWENKSNDVNLDWLSYGASWLFSQDLQRTPNISVVTPYDSKEVLSELNDKGFVRALDIPLSLALQVANNNSKKWMVLGSFIAHNDSIEFEAKLYNVETGIVEKVLTAINKNMLQALDQISNDISSYLLESNQEAINIIPDLAIEDHTSYDVEAIAYLISAKNKVTFENDYNGAIVEILKALELDESFAEANVLATSYYQAIGDFPNAIKQSKKALTLDYKIYKESVYALKANLFDMSGEQNKALFVLENWAKVYPASPIAHATLARKYLFSDDQLDKAEIEFEKLLSLDSGNQNTFIDLGKIYRVQGEKEKTIDVLEKYLSANPEKVDAYMELANAYKQFSMFEKAIEMYQQASILGSKDFEAEIAIASTIAITGKYKEAIKQLDDLLLRSHTDRKKFEVLNAKIVILMETGQINYAFEAMELIQEPAKNVLEPLDFMLSMDGSKVIMFIAQGNYKQALDYAESLRVNTKPPFTDLVSIFYILIYMAMEDEVMFRQELSSFESFLQTFPVSYYNQHIIAWNGKISYWQGDLQKSMQQLDQAITGSKRSILGLHRFDVVDEFIYNKAIILFELGRNDQALTELNFILNRNPLFTKSHYLKAKIYQQQGDLDNAQKSVQQAMDILADADADFVDLIALKQLQN
ncbi:MAG: tetratricopeptide repeat protein [Alcanivoracaceae bacterium]|nr:tetratricopeptide repeat protein [Alcanivoracaceae bacterium]